MCYDCRHKFRLTPCLTITELVCKSSEKTELLLFAITSLVQLLEDADSNTRLVIDESLNKIIRVSSVFSTRTDSLISYLN